MSPMTVTATHNETFKLIDASKQLVGVYDKTDTTKLTTKPTHKGSALRIVLSGFVAKVTKHEGADFEVAWLLIDKDEQVPVSYREVVALASARNPKAVFANRSGFVNLAIMPGQKLYGAVRSTPIVSNSNTNLTISSAKVEMELWAEATFDSLLWRQ
jgi:hypothetical protein